MRREDHRIVDERREEMIKGRWTMDERKRKEERSEEDHTDECVDNRRREK